MIRETLPNFRRKVPVFSEWARHRDDVRNSKGSVSDFGKIRGGSFQRTKQLNGWCVYLYLDETNGIIRSFCKIGVYYGTPQATFGGIALKFFASVRLEICSTGKIKSVNGEEVIGVRVHVRVQKSKMLIVYERVKKRRWPPHAAAVAAAKQRKELRHKRHQFGGEKQLGEQQEAQKERQPGPGGGWRQEKAQE
ncbi:recA DNA recombination family protein [Prunus dulcis]|uniref:RecA DNA recombination family protein n=1 Tax=Prunus dulcis TaxID=3755 RepID=A0A5H2XWD7_PRUDU|nr:recA DNA recombination family protein [Prunus dulcis]